MWPTEVCLCVFNTWNHGKKDIFQFGGFFFSSCKPINTKVNQWRFIKKSWGDNNQSNSIVCCKLDPGFINQIWSKFYHCWSFLLSKVYAEVLWSPFTCWFCSSSARSSRPTCIRTADSRSVVEVLPMSRHARRTWNAFCRGPGYWLLSAVILSILDNSTPSCTPTDTQHAVILPARSSRALSDGLAVKKVGYKLLLIFQQFAKLLTWSVLVVHKMYHLFCVLGMTAEVLSLLGNYHNLSRLSSHHSVCYEQTCAYSYCIMTAEML